MWMDEQSIKDLEFDKVKELLSNYCKSNHAKQNALKIKFFKEVKDLQKELGLSYLFISHDLRVVRHMADRIVVMHQGKIVEQGLTKSIYEKPKANYTRELLNAIPGNHFKFKVS